MVMAQFILQTMMADNAFAIIVPSKKSPRTLPCRNYHSFSDQLATKKIEKFFTTAHLLLLHSFELLANCTSAFRP
jgi:hypothetical protein